MNTISKRAVTREEIQIGMEAVLFDKAKAEVEVSMLGNNTWSVCGKPSHACRAIEWLESTSLAKEFYSEVLKGDLFIYFKTGA